MAKAAMALLKKMKGRKTIQPHSPNAVAFSDADAGDLCCAS
jgi:hypothetical protein